MLRLGPAELTPAKGIWPTSSDIDMSAGDIEFFCVMLNSYNFRLRSVLRAPASYFTSRCLSSFFSCLLSPRMFLFSQQAQQLSFE